MPLCSYVMMYLRKGIERADLTCESFQVKNQQNRQSKGRGRAWLPEAPILALEERWCHQWEREGGGSLLE